MERLYHRDFVAQMHRTNQLYITSRYRECMPVCKEGEPIYVMPYNKAHTIGHIHSVYSWQLFLTDGLCVWHRKGIKACNDSGHAPGDCWCHTPKDMRMMMCLDDDCAVVKWRAPKLKCPRGIHVNVA